MLLGQLTPIVRYSIANVAAILPSIPHNQFQPVSRKAMSTIRRRHEINGYGYRNVGCNGAALPHGRTQIPLMRDIRF